MKIIQQYIDIREEMESIKEKQQEIVHSEEKVSSAGSREMWRLQIIWEYLRDKLLLNDEAPRKNDYLN